MDYDLQPVDHDPFAAGQSYGPYMPNGMVEPGNIDLHNRPVVHNPDGSISTVRSISVGDGNGTVLLPTVVNGRVVSNNEAIEHYRRTGEHLGRFRDDAAADSYGQRLHEDQAREYLPQSSGVDLVPIDHDPFTPTPAPAAGPSPSSALERLMGPN